MFLYVSDVRALAEVRILEADGEALVPLSELASLRDNEERTNVLISLERLAHLEKYPAFFAAREWQLFRLQWHLEHLEQEGDPEEPGLDVYYRIQALKDLWEDLGQPIDWPLLSPFLRSYGLLTEFALVVHNLQVWIEEQHKFLNVVELLIASGFQEEVVTLSQEFKRMQANAQAHILHVKSELNTQQSVHKGSLPSFFWEKIKAFNTNFLSTYRRHIR